MNNQQHSSVKRVIACLAAVLMIFTTLPLVAFAADEHIHGYEAQGAVAVVFSNGKYVVGDETYKCACGDTKKERVYLDTDFNKFADKAKEILDFGKYKRDSKDYLALKSAYQALTSLTTGNHYEKFVDRRIKAVEAAINAFDNNSDENINTYTVKFVYYTEDYKEQTVTQTVAYGGNAAAPTLSSNFYWNEGRHYEFNGKWDRAFSNVKSDLVVTAQYKSGNDHDFVVKSQKVDSNCKTEGREIVEVCRVCGFEKGGEAIAKKEHTWGDWSNDGLFGLGKTHTRTCTVCGERQKLCKKEDHDLKHFDAKNATCLEDGYNAYDKCEDCDYNNKTIIKAVGHHTEVVVPAKAATCTEDGLKEGKICSVCKKEIVKQEAVKALGHDFSNEIAAPEYLKSAATCKAPAVYYKSCSRCGKATPDHTFNGQTLEHQFTKKLEGDATEANKGASCTEPAMYYYTCAVCGEVSKDQTYAVGSALGHKWGNPTSNGANKPQIRTCERCKITECVEKDGKSQHSLKKVPAKAATCTTAGYDEYWECENCDYEYEHRTYPAGHKYSTKETAVIALPTCLVAGKAEEYSFCVREDCPDKAEKIEEITVAALGHDYGELTDDGNGKTHTKVCKRSDCSPFVEGHSVTENHKIQKIEAKAATCLVDGNEAGEKCEICSYNTATVIKATGKHTEVEIPAVEATCAKTGLTAGKKCSVCGEILVPQEEVPMLTEHTPVEIPAVAATCTENGSTAGKKCSVCGKVLEEPAEIKALGHNYEVTTPAKEPTCTEDGNTEGKKCSVCGDEIKSEVIPNLGGHKEVAIPDVPGDCTTDKSQGGKKCSVCGVIIEEPVITPALGHDYKVSGEVKKATLTEDGMTESKTCSVCSDTIEGEVIPKIQSVTLTASKVNYTGKAWTPGVVVKDAYGNTLTRNVDYTVQYKNNIYPGKAIVTVTFIGNYEGSTQRAFTIFYTYTARTAKLAANQTTNAIKASWSAVSGAAGYRVQLYRGKTVVRTVTTTKTSVTFKKLANGKQLSPGTEYKVVVTAYSKIGGKIYYSTASRSLTTATKPLAPVVKSVSAGKKSVTLKWNKVTGATGYTVYYSTKKNSGFKPVKATTKTSRTVKALKSKTTYYVKVVANKKVSSSKLNSAFSKTYKVTVK